MAMSLKTDIYIKLLQNLGVSFDKEKKKLLKRGRGYVSVF
jgi:hypothetical protein